MKTTEPVFGQLESHVHHSLSNTKWDNVSNFGIKGFSSKKLQKCYLQWNFNWRFCHILVSGIQSWHNGLHLTVFVDFSHLIEVWTRCQNLDNLLASSEHVNLWWAIELMKSYFKISENKFDQLEMKVQGTQFCILICFLSRNLWSGNAIWGFISKFFDQTLMGSNLLETTAVF